MYDVMCLHYPWNIKDDTRKKVFLWLEFYHREEILEMIGSFQFGSVCDVKVWPASGWTEEQVGNMEVYERPQCTYRWGLKRAVVAGVV